MRKMIFVVDDNDINLTLAEQALEQHYMIMTLPSAKKMFALLERVKPDLILLDIEMPEIDGFEALGRLKADKAYADIPVMFVTGINDAEVEARGFELGVVDFVAKPFSAPVLLNRIKTHLHIDEIIRERTAQLQQLQNGLVFVLADMVENRDGETGGHVDRTARYIEMLINAMIERGIYADEIYSMDRESLVSSARLHDVGKISIPDSILNKPGKLTDKEFETMKTHPMEGERIIGQIVNRTGDVEFLQNARMFTSYHHERWDGHGYPYGLKGMDIPLQGRIMAIVDVYDALVSKRSYKDPFSEEESMKIIMENSGKQFDPNIVEVFYAISGQFAELHAFKA